jgi:hypothetical protein
MELPEPIRVLFVFRRRGAFVYEVADRDSFRQLEYAAKMVEMEMGGDKIVNLFYSGVFAGPEDTVDIAVHRLTGAGIDKDGLAQRSNNERRAPADHVQEVDFEGLIGAVRLRHGGTTGDNKYQGHYYCYEDLLHRSAAFI